ncbi:MAG: hypothetical protein KAW89_05015 [Armatimonadetes bacterium]|nr:hypothetical protein [Armatimonadota bacterium]
MTSRERVRRAVQFDGPDRLPILHGVLPGARWRHGQALERLIDEYTDDFGRPNTPRVPPQKPDDAGSFEHYTDDWGSYWVRLKGLATGEVKRPAIPDWDMLSSYQFPPLSPTHTQELRERIEQSGHEWFVNAGMYSLFEKMQALRGTENLLIDLAEDREEVHILADRLVDYYIDAIVMDLEAGPDSIYFYDDWGSQQTLLINPAKWRSFFKPRYQEMFNVVREAGLFIYFHTDGWTMDIVEDLIELGVSILNPQHVMMGEEFTQRFAGRVCIRSDLDRQHILPFGTPEQVTEHVKQVIRDFGNFNGGLILHGEIAPEIPFENIKAMYTAFKKYGGYPLSWCQE